MSYIEVVAHYATLTRLASAAEDQWGLLTRRQAELAGVSRATLQRLAGIGLLERVAHGVYHLAGAPLPDQVALRAAWLQLAPDVAAWERTPDQGIVSHRSAAALYSLGHLPADRHDFTLPGRRQSRRGDIRLHRRPLPDSEWTWRLGLPVTRPARIAADLMQDLEEPEAVAAVIADALRDGYDRPAAVATALAPHAARLGFRRGDGVALLRWLLGTLDDPAAPAWLAAAEAGPPAAAGAVTGAAVAPAGPGPAGAARPETVTGPLESGPVTADGRPR